MVVWLKHFSVISVFFPSAIISTYYRHDSSIQSRSTFVLRMFFLLFDQKRCCIGRLRWTSIIASPYKIRILMKGEAPPKGGVQPDWVTRTRPCRCRVNGKQQTDLTEAVWTAYNSTWNVSWIHHHPTLCLTFILNTLFWKTCHTRKSSSVGNSTVMCSPILSVHISFESFIE